MIPWEVFDVQETAGFDDCWIVPVHCAITVYVQGEGINVASTFTNTVNICTCINTSDREVQRVKGEQGKNVEKA